MQPYFWRGACIPANESVKCCHSTNNHQICCTITNNASRINTVVWLPQSEYAREQTSRWLPRSLGRRLAHTKAETADLSWATTRLRAPRRPLLEQPAQPGTPAQACTRRDDAPGGLEHQNWSPS